MKTNIFAGDYRITSPYGYRTLNGKTTFHDGIDFSMVVGTELWFPQSGVIRRATKDQYGGLYIQGKFADGTGLWFLHNSKHLLKQGDSFKAGQVVALSGNTGLSSGPHVHVGRQSNADSWGSHIDPMPFITVKAVYVVGDRVEFLSDTNLRHNPNDGVVNGVVSKGAVGEIIGGPRQYEIKGVTYTFYDVNVGNGQGWMADLHMKKTTRVKTYMDGSKIPTGPTTPPPPPIEQPDPCIEVINERNNLADANLKLQNEKNLLTDRVEKLELDVKDFQKMLMDANQYITRIEDENFVQKESLARQAEIIKKYEQQDAEADGILKKLSEILRRLLGKSE